ncbi:Trichothecene 3-O-acetyltransferase [Cytospora mali]|uniref:Trichothecene 3-O-acetyltransferase n=1 Tax=Cytospora mali TaxID=578113 RepID=A0A194VZY9_CYTMA|nr:Trichothecene 3-O-acetyltransferase [Valsa mali]
MADTNFQEFERYQDVLGQMTFLKTYTHIALGFQPTSSVAVITRELENAAIRLVETFPWIGGHVIRQGKGPGKTGLAAIIPYPPGERATPVIVKDATGLCPSMHAIMSAGVPMAVLDGDVLAVRKGLPDGYDETDEPAPVLVIQANIIDGGLILAFQGNHNIVDMNGLGQIIRLYAKALCGEPFSDVEVEQGNRDRRHIIKLLGPDDEKVDISKYLVKPPPTNPSQTNQPQPDLQWVYLHFSGHKLYCGCRTAVPSR